MWDGASLHADALGYADLERRIPMRLDNLFWAASNGKAVACALVLTYVDEGLIGLDDPVENYLPEWKAIKVHGEAPRAFGILDARQKITKGIFITFENHGHS